MSATSYATENCLDFRSSASKPGARKFAKTRYVRAQRKQANKSVAQEIQLLNPALVDPTELHELSEAEMDAYANWLLAQNADEYYENFVDPAIDSVDAALDETVEQVQHELSRVPLYLEAALPDWMISQLQAANGNAFDVLSLFEAKSPSPKAAISMEDEALYA